MSESDVSDALREFILVMARREDVNSVSCQFVDFTLWEELLKEQVRRAKQSGKKPHDAFFLCGPDSGILNVAKDHPGLEDTPRDKWYHGNTLEEKLGGDIHIPYEGVCGADLFVYPDWREIYPEAWTEDGATLDSALAGKRCNHLLIDRDLGKIRCATRITPVQGWWLYSSTEPHRDCNPLHRGR